MYVELAGPGIIEPESEREKLFERVLVLPVNER